MRLSLQTVWIIFGVTLAHLFVISALSPLENDNAAPRPKIVLDPELESLLEAEASSLAGDMLPEAADEMPIHPLGGGESNATPAPAREEPVAPPAPDLAGNEATRAPASPPAPDEPPAIEPAPAIREIRAIAPVPRS